MIVNSSSNKYSFKGSDFIANYAQNFITKPIPEVKQEQAPAANTALTGNDFIANYAQVLVNRTKPAVKTEQAQTPQIAWKNDLRSMFENNKVVMHALIPRTFNAKDKDGNHLIEDGEEQGTFYNAVERLDELKKYGVNTLHLLPINPPGTTGAFGTAGSLYAPKDYLQIDETLGGKEGFKYFVDECHKKGIRVMVDLPSCASLDLFNARPDLMAVDERGYAETPQGWQDIRMFDPYTDKDKKILNKALVDYHKQFVDMLLECGADGIRADVARAKPAEFWDEIISYTRSKNPEFAFLAETYTYEDASPMLNMPHDRPEELLAVGFDSYYGQYHIFPLRQKASYLHDYVVENLDMSHRLPKGKSLIGSFATHDDKSPISNGGVPYCNLTTGLQFTLPMTNPYFVTGFESGDTYIYPYKDKPAQKSATDSFQYIVHSQMVDIFNLSRKPGGEHPEIGDFMGRMAQIRKDHEDLIAKGSYIPFKDTQNKNDKIIAYARHKDGKTLLTIANRDVNAVQKGKITIPGLKASQPLVDLTLPYGQPSRYTALNNTVEVELGPARVHVFEIDTPDIEKKAKEVYKQNI
ncbi:MAG: alpha-amylase family glycosyl hydrolase [Candidatus Gastranaerophilales bacterium]|nr:alpha-amylase family glycosyl hydrolase [Candidatus Gastranaerophilales bacterium]